MRQLKEELPEQFLVCRDPGHIPMGWRQHALGSWHLGHHPSQPIVSLSAEDGSPIGWLLGYAINAEGVFLSVETVTVPVPSAASVSADLESWIYSHGGRFVVICLTETDSRVYLDPCGSLSLVYCAPLEMIASTGVVIPLEEGTEKLTELAEEVGIPPKFMYPLEWTPRKNIWRLLPNHYLDLVQWQSVRHWPKEEIIPSVDATFWVERIVERTRLQIGAFVAHMPVLLRLTAGCDSRILLACARSWVKRMTVITAEQEHPDEIAWLDCLTAKKIAQDCQLYYRPISYRSPRQEDLEEWLLRTGYSVNEYRGWRSCATYKQLPSGHVDLLGVGGELARGYYWRPDDREETVIDLNRILTMTEQGWEKNPLFCQTLSRWLESAPSRNPFLVLDLFYLEQCLGGWGGVFPYAYGQDGRFMVFPFCHRDIISAILSLPLAVRREGSLARLVAEREWPALLRYPFNQAHGLQQIGLAWYRVRQWARAVRLRRVAWRSVQAINRLRKRVSLFLGASVLMELILGTIYRCFVMGEPIIW